MFRVLNLLRRGIVILSWLDVSSDLLVRHLPKWPIFIPFSFGFRQAPLTSAPFPLMNVVRKVLTREAVCAFFFSELWLFYYVCDSVSQFRWCLLSQCRSQAVEWQDLLSLVSLLVLMDYHDQF
jgi:hypothetical protein